MKWHENLPETSLWQPRSTAKETLMQSLRLTCQATQLRIIQEGRIERAFNIHAYDSGPGLEDVVRQELRKLLPKRYEVTSGVLDDASGATAGDCDVLIANFIWASPVKPGATELSKRTHIPIEAVYAVLEIKQTLSYKRLDEAMAKLVASARLQRPPNPYGHITENQHIESFDKEGFILNPLFTAVVSTGTSRGTKFDDLASRFFRINQQLGRDEMVKMLCVLGHGVAFYTMAADTEPAVSADFCRDRDKSLKPTISDACPEDSFFKLYTELFCHLTRSVVPIQELANKYGGTDNRQVRFVSVGQDLNAHTS